MPICKHLFRYMDIVPTYRHHHDITVSCEKYSHASRKSLRVKSNLDQQVLSILEKIELEMKNIGFWKDNPPKFQAKNYLDSPSFELWLQCVFIPNARNAAATGKYPKGSQVGLMAMRQYDYHSCVEEALSLVQLLREFDSLIEGASA